MGWLWASSSSSPTPTPPAQPQPAPTPREAPPSAAPSEPVDPEVQKFFDLFKPDAEPLPPTPASASASTSDSTSHSDSDSSPSRLASWLSLRAAPKPTPAPASAPPRDALAESLLPTEMSCRQAFDLAWSCNSLGGQFNSVYRYGSMRSCSEHWDDFWFCMRTKSYTGELKENMIRQHYRNKEYAKYGPQKPSSEHVWEPRAQKLPPGTAFSHPIDGPDVGDDEWRAREAERRRDIRQALARQEESSGTS